MLEMDSSSKSILSSSASFSTHNTSPTRRERSPDKARKIRRGDAVEFGDRAGNSEILLREGFQNSRTVLYGRNSEARTVNKDLKSYAAPNPELVDGIINNIDKGRKIRARGSGKLAPLDISGESTPGSSSKIKRLKNNYVVDNSGIVETSQLNQIPNARLGVEVPMANNTTMLGSTQLEGCRGDFCDFDVAQVENAELKATREDLTKGAALSSAGGASVGNRTLNEFRQRLAMMDQNTEDQQKQSSYMTSLIKGDTKKNEFGRKVGAEPAKATKMVGLNMIIQCRMEMPFVKLQLRRHKNNEHNTDYASEESYSDLAVGMKLPAHYYNDVPVCDTCHRVYNIVSTARQKSVVKIERKLDQQKMSRMKANASTSDYFESKNKLDGKKVTMSTVLGDRERKILDQKQNSGVQQALEAVAGLTKHDVAEIRTLNKPHAAVVAVMEAVMTLLTGHPMPFDEMKKLLATGDLFLTMLKEFRLEQIDDFILVKMEGYVDNPVFRPEHVRPISMCASKFCAWVLGVVQAARWQRGMGHKRTNFMASDTATNADSGDNIASGKQLAKTRSSGALVSSSVNAAGGGDGLTFVQRLEAKRNQKRGGGGDTDGSVRPYEKPARSVSPVSRQPRAQKGQTQAEKTASSLKHLSQRDMVAFKAAQNKSVNRLSSLVDNGKKLVGDVQYFKCRDGITKMPYVVIGSMSLQPSRCNFVVCHDFFDTYDGTCILFKSLAQQHPGCQIVCFNYPGQSNTVWPRPPKVEKDRGAKEPVLNNDFIADRMNELLHHIELDGGIMLSTPFHLVGMGNGACIAAAFAQRWGKDPHYAPGLRSIVSVNGFLAPDPQLVGVLHQAAQLFESTPHNRPDIPVSYWARFMFSNGYLEKIHPNLALNIYTAVSNPITNDGRYKLTTGCINHRDLRAGLAPDADLTAISDTIDFELSAVTVPVIMLQSTDNSLVNASNVDPFLKGRTTKHLWSHQQNILSEGVLARAKDVQSQWVGGMASGPEDYSQFSMLGKDGVRLMMDTLNNPRGCFVMWTTAGHLVQQENKRAILDFLDVLACPTEEYTGTDANSGISFGSKIAVNPNFKAEGLTTGSQKLPDEESNDLTGSFVITKPSYDGKEGGKGGSGRSTPQIDLKLEESPPPKAAKESDANADIEIAPVTIDLAASAPAGTVAGSVSESDVEISPRATSSQSGFVSSLKKKIEGDEGFSAPPSKHATPHETPVKQAPVEEPAPVSSIPVSPIAAKKTPVEDLLATPVASPAPKQASPAPQPSASPAPKSTAPTPLPAASTPEKRVSPAPSQAQSPERAPVVSVSASPQRSPEVTKANNADSVSQPVEMETKTLTLSPNYPELPLRNTAAAASAPPAVASEGANAITAIDPNVVSTRDEQNARTWTMSVPDAHEVMELEGEIAAKQKEYLEVQSRFEKEKIEAEVAKLNRLKKEQLLRARQYEDEDRALMHKLEKELADRRRERALAEKQRLLEIQNIDKKLVETGVVDAHKGSIVIPDVEDVITDDMDEKDRQLAHAVSLTENDADRAPVSELPPLRYEKPIELPKIITDGIKAGDVEHQLTSMLEDEKDAKKRGNMSVDEYEKVKRQMAQRQMERDQKLRHLATQEQHALFDNSAKLIQRIGRGYNGRKRADNVRTARENQRRLNNSMTKAQALARGMAGRRRARLIKMRYLQTLKYGASTLLVQRVYRGHRARKRFRTLVRMVSSRNIQRFYRGRIGRKAAQRERDRLDLLRRKQIGACKIQSVWRMKVSKEEFRSMRIHMLAAIEIQRSYRGYLGRKRLNRRRKWESTAPGPDRIKLGLELIEESKVAFERQQEEIDALHRAQERAESRVSHITSDLKDSEREMLILERELQEIDQIERDLMTLTHERELLSKNVKDAAGMPRIADKGHEGLVMGKEPSFDGDPDLERRRKAEAYALEMTIQIKRAEREKKRQELETEFAAVFQDVEKKKKALQRLEASLADMESTRERKDREFRRLQKNLMQLLLEQKQELDELREKGIELETATATTAAAATATAQKAKEHEKQSTAMFSQTEELMKFQFMSMSLSYFSSLNMLKSLRDMNADTTSAAVASSADAAAAAAASAAAANLPNMKKLQLGASDVVELSIQKKKAELESAELAEKEAKKARANPLPDNVKLWTVADVTRWLGTLSLGQYTEKFQEATVDGPFLMELREEDLVDVLAIKHKLHVRKILISREKLKPLNEQQLAQKEVVEREVSADFGLSLLSCPCVFSCILTSIVCCVCCVVSGTRGCSESLYGCPCSGHGIQSGAQRPHQACRGVTQPWFQDRFGG